MNNPEINVGIDTSSQQLDIYVRLTGQFFSVSHDLIGINHAVKQLQALKPARVLIESTGRLELELACSAHKAGLPVVIFNPGQVRHFAKAAGRITKTDKPERDLIVSAKGVGKVLTYTLMSELPELGALNRREIAV